jgi:hypothetical protein
MALAAFLSSLVISVSSFFIKCFTLSIYFIPTFFFSRFYVKAAKKESRTKKKAENPLLAVQARIHACTSSHAPCGRCVAVSG